MSETLYERLGGEAGISAIAHDIIANHQVNPVIKARFQDSDVTKLHRLVVEFFGMGTGGPQQYSGEGMLKAHRGMNISEQEFLAVLDDGMKAMTKNNVAPEVQNEVLAILYSLKEEIIRV